MLEFVAEVLFAASWKSVFVIAAAGLAARWTKSKARPAQAHALWVAALATLLCLPVLEALKSAWPQAAYPRLEVSVPGVGASATATTAELDGRAVKSTGWTSVSIQSGFAACYLLGLALAAGRLAIGCRTARRIVSAAQPVVSERVLAELASIADACRMPAPPRLLSSNRFRVPVTVGLWRPAILLPAGCESWEPSRMRAVLAHECGHVVRRDTRSAAVVACARTIYWFHPLVWRIARQTSRLMEQACDDFAVNLTGNSREYAEALVDAASLGRGLQV